MTAHFAPPRIGTKARILEAIRHYFRVSGMSPSFSEIGSRAGVSKQRVGRYLDELQRDEYLSYIKGEARSILMSDPCANISDVDLLAACIGRGWIIVQNKPEISAITPWRAPYPQRSA